MLHVTPIAEPLEEEAGPRWPALLASAGIHLVLIAFILFRTRPEPVPAQVVDFPEDRQEMALEPMPTFEQPERRASQPPPDETPLGPDSNRPDARIPQERGEVIPPPVDVAPSPDNSPNTAPPVSEPAPGPPAPAERVARADETGQTGRLQTPTSPWGPSRTVLSGPASTSAPATASAGAMGRTGLSNVDGRAWRPTFGEAAGKCVEIPDFGTNPDGTPVLASVMGIVKDDRGFPLPGAHLQLVGHTFSTFSDRQGRYRLEFNPTLLQKCRVQYIRVSADGYSGANLTLSIGRRVVSDDVVLRRK